MNSTTNTDNLEQKYRCDHSQGGPTDFIFYDKKNNLNCLFLSYYRHFVNKFDDIIEKYKNNNNYISTDIYIYDYEKQKIEINKSIEKYLNSGEKYYSCLYGCEKEKTDVIYYTFLITIFDDFNSLPKDLQKEYNSIIPYGSKGFIEVPAKDWLSMNN